MKFTESIEAARLRVGAWNRERKERAAEKRAEREAIRPPNAAPLVWCVLLTMVGVAALSGSTWIDRKSTRLNSSHIQKSRMPSSA